MDNTNSSKSRMVTGLFPGAAVRAAGGPLGMAASAAVGALAGCLAGEGAAEVVNPKREDGLRRHNPKPGNPLADGSRGA